MSKMSDNVSDHMTYVESYRLASDWLSNASEVLEGCADVSGEKAAVLERLDTVKVMHWFKVIIVESQLCKILKYFHTSFGDPFW